MDKAEDRISETENMAKFKSEASHLLKEFNSKIEFILERIRERKLKEIRDKMQK